MHTSSGKGTYVVYAELIDVGAQYPQNLFQDENVNPPKYENLKKIIDNRKEFMSISLPGTCQRFSIYENSTEPIISF